MAGAFLGASVVGDDRVEPEIRFTLPSSLPDVALPRFVSDVYIHSLGGRTIGLFLPRVEFWNHITQALLLTTVFGVVSSFIVYHHVIKNRRTKPRTSRAVGCATILANILFPYAVVALLDVRNLVVKFTLCASPALFMFRTSEAIFGFSPLGVERSLFSYICHYAVPFELELDLKTGRPLEITREEMSTNLSLLIGSFARVCILMTLLAPSDFEPFEGRPGEMEGDDGKISPMQYLRLGHLGNCFLAAYMFQLLLGLFGFAMSAVVQFGFGLKTNVSMRNPMLEATSPSDFWGKRWNTLVHGVLKRGVYKPVRRHSSAFMASLAAFVASGVFHEWIVSVMAFKRECPGDEPDCYQPEIGSNATFFLWNAGVIAVESLLRRNALVEKVGSILPRIGVTIIIIMTSLPLAHLFADPYIRAGFFSHYKQGFPLLAFI